MKTINIKTTTTNTGLLNLPNIPIIKLNEEILKSIHLEGEFDDTDFIEKNKNDIIKLIIETTSDIIPGAFKKCIFYIYNYDINTSITNVTIIHNCKFALQKVSPNTFKVITVQNVEEQEEEN